MRSICTAVAAWPEAEKRIWFTGSHLCVRHWRFFVSATVFMRRHRVVLMGALVPYIRLYRRSDLVSNLAPIDTPPIPIVPYLRRHLPTRIRCTVHVLTYVRVYSLCRPCVLSYRIVPPGISSCISDLLTRYVSLSFLSFLFSFFPRRNSLLDAFSISDHFESSTSTLMVEPRFLTKFGETLNQSCEWGYLHFVERRRFATVSQPIVIPTTNCHFPFKRNCDLKKKNSHVRSWVVFCTLSPFEGYSNIPKGIFIRWIAKWM